MELFRQFLPEFKTLKCTVTWPTHWVYSRRSAGPIRPCASLCMCEDIEKRTGRVFIVHCVHVIISAGSGDFLGIIVLCGPLYPVGRRSLCCKMVISYSAVVYLLRVIVVVGRAQHR